MERTEPTLVPEWLRGTGNVAAGGSLVRLSDASSANSARSRSFKSNGEKGSPRRLDRSSSFDSRSSSISSGSAKHPYSSFSRSQRDKKWDRDKGKPHSDDTWYRDSSESSVCSSNSRIERDVLRYSHSSGPGEALPHKVKGSWTGNNGVVKGSSNLSATHKVVFEKNFPSLGKEEKKALARSRMGLSSPSHILPLDKTGFLNGEKWTSALAEVPLNDGANVKGYSSLQKNVEVSNSSSMVSTATGLNMAVALSQPALQSREALQLPDKSLRLEELAIKQSRQLIPLTPSMPKLAVPILGDKSKQWKHSNSGATVAASRTVHTVSHPNHLANQSHASQIRHDLVTNPHVGKFLVLKSNRENGANMTAKNSATADNDVNGVVIANGQQAMHMASPKASTIPSNSKTLARNKTDAISQNSLPNFTDKKASQSLVQSRSEFFNLMRRKNSSGLATSLSDPSPAFSHDKAESPREILDCHGDSNRASENGKEVSGIEENNGYFNTTGLVYPDEEEAAFLRSLGWEENGGEDEGLTEEEIDAFYQEYMHKTPSLKLCGGFQPKCSTIAKLEAISGITTSDSTTKTEPEPS